MAKQGEGFSRISRCLK